jgi:uncharacterized phage protein gp47/JayE
MPVADSFEDLLSIGQAEAQTRRPDLQYSDGDVTIAQLHAAAAMADAAIRFSSQAFRDTFIDGATGDALTDLVNDHLNIQRKAATAAQVTLSFSRSPGAAGTIPAGTTVATLTTADGVQINFTLDAAIAVDTSGGPFTGSATATEVGPDGNVASSTVQIIVDALFDDFTVTNTAAAGGGNNEESDEELRKRARDFFATLRRGTLAALEEGALQVASVRVVSAIEDATTGQIQVRVSDSDGNSTAEMVADVEAELENWRCAGSNVTVVGGTQLAVDMTLRLIARDGFDVAAAGPTIIDAVETRMNKLSTGETLFLDGVIAAAINVFADDVNDVNLDDSGGSSSLIIGGTPQSGAAADVVPTSGQTIRPGTIIVEVA